MPQLVVKREWSVWRIVTMLVLVLGVGASVMALSNMRGVGIKASPLTPSPTPLTQILPPPADLTVPYLRLVSDRLRYLPGETAAVGVYLHTDGKEALEADLEIIFDPEVLALADAPITKENIFKTVSSEIKTAGKAIFRLYSRPEIGQSTVKTSAETKIATLKFKVLGVVKNTQISLGFDPGKTSASGLYLVQSTGRSKENVLAQVEAASFEVAP